MFRNARATYTKVPHQYDIALRQIGMYSISPTQERLAKIPLRKKASHSHPWTVRERQTQKTASVLAMSAPSWLKSFAKSKKPKPAPEKSETAPAPPSQAPTDQHVEDYQQISADDYVQMIEGAGVALPKKRAAPSTDAERAGKQNKPSMREALQEGLSNPLAEDNVGFRMICIRANLGQFVWRDEPKSTLSAYAFWACQLAKMGFKSGQGLGKDAAGTAQPLDVRMRGRSGLGVEEEKIRKQKEELRRQEEEMR
eukprot:387335-Rhodomonas_salina.2